MLEIFNSLEPFFKENYRRINVREYARIQKISPPSASKYLEEELINPVIILFGYFAKAEITDNSDIDIAIFSDTKKKLDLGACEKKLGRKIQIFSFQRKEDIKNKELLN